MGNALCAPSETVSNLSELSCTVESVWVSLQDSGHNAQVLFEMETISTTYNQKNNISFSVSSISAKSLQNGLERVLLKSEDGMRFIRSGSGVQAIVRPLIAVIDVNLIKVASEIISAAIPPLPIKERSVEPQPIPGYNFDVLCVITSAVQIGVCVDSNSTFAASWQSFEYHHLCLCRGKSNGCARLNHLKVESISCNKHQEEIKTSICSSINFDVIISPAMDRFSLTLESAVNFTISFAIISSAQRFLDNISQHLPLKKTQTKAVERKPLDFSLQFSSLVFAVNGNEMESVMLTLSHFHANNKILTIGNIALLFSDQEKTTSILSCASSPIASVEFSPNSSFIETTSFRVGLPFKFLHFLASIPFTPSVESSPERVAHSGRSSSIRVLLPLLELKLYDHTRDIINIQLSDLFALTLPAEPESPHSLLSTSTLRFRLIVTIGNDVFLQPTLLSFEQARSLKELSKLNNSYPNFQSDILSATTDSINIQVFPEQVALMQTTLDFFLRLPTASSPNQLNSVTSNHVSSHDDLRSLYIAEEMNLDLKPGRIVVSENEIAWRYMAFRCVTHVSLSALHVSFTNILSLSAVDPVTQERVLIDQIHVDLNRTTAHRVLNSVTAETWIISWTASPLLSSADLVQILRIDSVSGPSLSKFLQLSVLSFCLTISSRRNGLEADHAIISGESLRINALKLSSLAVSTTHLDRLKVSVYRYSDLVDIPLASTSDMECLLIDCLNSSEPSIPLTSCYSGNSRFFKISMHKSIRFDINNCTMDALIYAVESIQALPKKYVSPTEITLASCTTRPHHCSDILLHNNLSFPINYRQEGQLKSVLLSPGDTHNFTWTSILRQQLRISCFVGLWSEPFVLNDNAAIRLYRHLEFTDLKLTRQRSTFSFESHFYVTSKVTFCLELKILTISDKSSEPVSTRIEILQPQSENLPVALWLPIEESVRIEYQLRPCISDIDWFWNDVSESCLMVFHDSTGMHERSIWFRSDGHAILIAPTLTVYNRTDTPIHVSFFGHKFAQIGPHQNFPAYDYEESSNLVFALGTEIESLSSLVKLSFPNESESVASHVMLNSESMAVAVMTLNPDEGLTLEIFSSVVVQNLTNQEFTVIDRNDVEIHVPSKSSASAFWVNPIDARFYIVGSDEVLRSQQLHCKRSGLYNIDLCSAVKLHVCRIVMSVKWLSSSSSKSYDLSSRCEITLKARYCFHNQCPFPIVVRPESLTLDNAEVVNVQAETSVDILGWPLASPPIQAIRDPSSFEVGAWLVDNSTLRLSRVSSDQNWGWSTPITCSSKEDRQQRALIKLRNRQLGFEMVLSCIRLSEEHVTHLLLINDVQVPLLLVNTTSHKLSYFATSQKNQPPSNLNLVKTDLEAHQATQIAPELFEEERIFSNRTHAMSIYLRALSTEWSSVPIVLKSGGSPQLVELPHLSAGSLHISQPHMLGSSPSRLVQRQEKVLSLMVNSYNRNGTLISIVSSKENLVSKPINQSRPSLFEVAATSVELCFSNAPDKNGFAFIFMDLSAVLKLQHDERYMSIFPEHSKRFAHSKSAVLKVRDFQIEHLVNPVEYPIVAHNETVEDNFKSIEICLDLGAQLASGDEEYNLNPLHFMMKSSHIEKFSISVSPLRLYIEDAFILTVTEFTSEMASSVFRRPHQANSQHSSATPDIHSDTGIYNLIRTLSKPRFAAHRFSISSIDLRLTYLGSRAYLTCQALPITLASLELSSVLAPADHLVKELSANYLADMIMIAPILFGSMDLLGNPTQLIGSISRGISDLVKLPTRAFTQGPKAFAWATLQGIGSLLHNMSEGTLTSLSGFTYSLARNVDHVSPDQYHIFQANRNSSSQRGISSGLANGATSFATGVVLGVTGVVSAPIRGVVNQGAWGFVKGVGAGIAGLVTKPVSGALDMVSETSRGIAATAGLSPVLPPIRHQCTLITPNDVLFRISTLRLKTIAHNFQEVYQKHFYLSPVLDADEALLYERALVFCTNAGLYVIAAGSDRVVQSIPRDQLEIIFSVNESIQVRQSNEIAFQFNTDHTTKQSFVNCIYQITSKKINHC